MFNLFWITVVAILVGACFTIGKFIGNLITDVAETFVVMIFKKMARGGNVVMQEVCRKHRIDYKGGTNKQVIKNQIGFRID